MMSDKANDLLSEVNGLPGTLPEIGEAAAIPAAINPMDKPLWEIDSRFLDPFAPLPPVPMWARMGERRAIPRTGVVMFSAKPKAGKSVSIYALLIPIITGKPFDSLTPEGEKPRLVVVFDTEMDKATLQERYPIKQLGDDYRRFMVVPLLEETKSKRREIIEDITEQYNPDIVVVDTIGRLVEDFNASGESQDFGEWAMRLAAKRTVLGVLHQNKAADNTQMKGHLGSILEELATENYSVTHSKGIRTIKPVNSRRSPVDETSTPFIFALGAAGEIIPATTIAEKNRAEEAERWRDNFSAIFAGNDTLTHGEMVSRIMEKEGLESRAARNKITAAIAAGALEKTGTDRRAPYRVTEAPFSENFDPNFSPKS